MGGIAGSTGSTERADRGGRGPADAGKARYFEAGEGGAFLCSLCHRRCRLVPGATGACRVRRNDGGAGDRAGPAVPFNGMASALAVDPIEKKPLYHFLPGSLSYSVGYVGCNLRCPFCQNYRISQSTDAPLERVTPELLVASARAARCLSIAHTYSEPIVHAEFVEAAMRAARDAGLASVLVTNGCAGPDAAAALLSACDAVNVDIKCWDEAFYRDELGGDLGAVMRFVETAVSYGVHVEATTLVIPGRNDDPRQIEGIASFLADLSPDIPLHVSAYRPMYRYTLPATPSATVRRLSALAAGRLRYVYPGNLVGERSVTACAACGAALVTRRGYAVDASGLKGDRCAACGTQSPLRVWLS